MNDLISKIKERILHPLPGEAAQLRMAPPSRPLQLKVPDDARQSAVMILLFKENEIWHTLLMHRTEDGRVHSGQISFPGGRKDEADEDMIATALRECEEEIGVKRSEIAVLGIMSPLYIPPSNFQVTPVLGYLPADFTLNLSLQEVQEVIKISLNELFDDKIKGKRAVYTSANQQMEAPVYVVFDSKIVWGATAMIISELEDLIKEMI